MARNESIERLSVTADTLDEAAAFVVTELQGLSEARQARGFTAPTCTQESFEIVDGKWSRVFEFQAEFLGVA